MHTPLLQDAGSVSSQKFLKQLDRRLSVVIHETWAHRELIHRVNAESFRPPMPTIPPMPPSSSPIASTSTKKPAQSLRDHEEQLRAVARSKKKARRFQTARRTKAAATEQERRDASSIQMEVLGDEVLEDEVLEDELLPEEKVSCRVCQDKKMDERCIRILEVDDRPDTADLVGAALTCAPPDDRLQPLPQVCLPLYCLHCLLNFLKPQRRDGTTPPPRDIRFVNPKDLGLTWVQPRPETFKQCGKDITRFVMRSDGNIVSF